MGLIATAVDAFRKTFFRNKKSIADEPPVATAARALVNPDNEVTHRVNDDSELVDVASGSPLVTQATLNDAIAGIAERTSVRVATTANVTIATALNNGDTLDGVTLATGDLVLVKDQSTGHQNGIYVVGATPARHEDFDAFNDYPGVLVTVQEGAVNADTAWLCTSNRGGTLGSTGIVFAPAAERSTGVAYVVASGGSDTTGQVGNPSRPFATIAAAVTAAAAGNLVEIAPGVFDERNIVKTGIGIDLRNQTGVVYSGAVAGGLIDDSATGRNGAIVGALAGFGRLNQAGAVNDAATLAAIKVTNAASDVRVSADRIELTGDNSGAGLAFAVEHTGGKLTIRANEIVDNTTTGDAVALWWSNGPADIVVNELRQESTSAGSYVVYIDASEAQTGEFYLRANSIVCETADSSVVIHAQGDEAAFRGWIEALQIDNQGTGSGSRAVNMTSAGKLYVTAQKGWGMVSTDGAQTGELHVRADKWEARNTEALFEFAGEGETFINIGLVVKGNGGNLATISAGTHRITGMRFVGGATTAGIALSGGTLILENCTINTAANSGTSPITKSGGTLICKNCTFVAEGTADSIASADPQTVSLMGCFSNRALGGDITNDITGGLITDAQVA